MFASRLVCFCVLGGMLRLSKTNCQINFQAFSETKEDFQLEYDFNKDLYSFI
jgi:hypothetical protein